MERALLHVFTRSLPYTSAQVLKVEEALDGEKVQYNVPAELSDYIFREFLCSGSVHPVRLVQDFLLKGLADKWSVSMTTEAASFLLTAKQLQECRHDIDSTQFYWIRLLQKDVNYDGQTVTDKVKDLLMDRERVAETGDAPLDKTDRMRSKGSECLRSACSFDGNPEEESGLYGLRPSLLPQMEELLAKKEQLISNTWSNGENKGNDRSVQVEGHTNDRPLEDCSGVMSLLFGMSGAVFRNVSINPWALPAFHELLLRGVFPLECNPIKLIGKRLETLLAPYGVSLVKEQNGLHLMAQPVGSVGKVFADNSNTNDTSHINMNVSLNLDLLAVLFFSLPDWRLLWSYDPRFLKQFASQPSPGKPFQPFSLFPEHFNFDISFWTGPAWEERQFYAVVREASHGTVEQVKLIDSFSHPDLSQTSYCYRLTYHSHTHALSHTQALQFHKHLESLLSTQLEVIIR